VTGDGTPPAVRRFVLAPLLWVGVALIVVTPAAIADLRDSGRRVPADRAVVVAAQVAGTYAGAAAVPIEYAHPATRQRVAVDLTVRDSAQRPRAGATIGVEVDRDDPDAVQLPGDPGDGPAVLSYGWLPVIPLLAVGLRARHLRRIRRLAAADLPSYAMAGAIAPPRRGSSRCLLHLYPLDASDGAPRCAPSRSRRRAASRWRPP
jgi:hypothetical protein